MPAPPRHGRDYATTAPTPADTSIFLTTLASQRLFGWRTGFNWSSTKENEARLRLLQGFYTLVNADEVHRFLRVYPDAADVLIEARPHIERIFGSNTRVTLEVTFDPDSESLRDSEELFADIQTSLPVDAALARLHKLDQDWFLSQLCRVKGRLNFSLEFV
jgi:hypothetical protein